MSTPDPTPRATTSSIDDGSDDDVTGSTAGTARDELDHQGAPRSGGTPSDGGATDAAAREMTDENEDEPTRSE